MSRKMRERFQWYSLTGMIALVIFLVVPVVLIVLLHRLLYTQLGFLGESKDFWDGLSVGVVVSTILGFLTIYASRIQANITKQKNHREDFSSAVQLLAGNVAEAALIAGAHLIKDVAVNAADDDDKAYLAPAVHTLQIAVRDSSVRRRDSWFEKNQSRIEATSDRQGPTPIHRLNRKGTLLPDIPRSPAIKPTLDIISDLIDACKKCGVDIQKLELEETDLRDFRLSGLVRLAREVPVKLDRADLRCVNVEDCSPEAFAGWSFQGAWINPCYWDPTACDGKGGIVFRRNMSEVVAKQLVSQGAALFLQKNWSGPRIEMVRERFSPDRCLLRIVGGPGVVFDGACLEGVNCDLGFLIGASFRGSYLKDASFQGADLSGADFTGAEDLDVTMFEGANLYGARGLDHLFADRQ